MKNFKFNYIAVGLLVGSIFGMILGITVLKSNETGVRYQIVYILLCAFIVILTTKKIEK